MLPTDIAKFAQGKTDAELKTAHRAHHERLHAAAVIVAKPSANPAENVAALKAALAVWPLGAFGGEIILADGEYVIDKTIEIRGGFGLRFRGVGGGTAFIWAGPADQPAFRITMSRECVFSDFRIHMQSPGYAGVQVLRDAGAGWSTAHNQFSNLMINCANTTEYAVVIGGRGAIDANNDFHLFEHCTLNLYTHTGVLMSGSQAYNQQFVNCSLVGGTGAQYGYDTGNVGASIHVMGGGMNGHAAADFLLGRSAQTHIIQFVNSEGSGRFIESANHPYRQVVVEGCRWSGTRLHADDRAIVTEGLINLSLRYCSIGDGVPSPNRKLLLQFGNTRVWQGGGVVMEGCRVSSAAANLFSGDAPIRVDACTKITDDDSNTIEILTVAG